MFQMKVINGFHGKHAKIMTQRFFFRFVVGSIELNVAPYHNIRMLQIKCSRKIASVSSQLTQFRK